MIKAAEAEEHTLVVAKKMSVIRRFREVSGGRVATGASAPEMVAFIICSHLYPSCPLRPFYQALQVWKGVGTLRVVQAAHQAGIRVDVWTVDAKEDMRRFIDYGVDGNHRISVARYQGVEWIEAEMTRLYSGTPSAPSGLTTSIDHRARGPEGVSLPIAA